MPSALWPTPTTPEHSIRKKLEIDSLLLDLDNFGLARGQGTARLASWGQTRRIRDYAR